MTINACEAVVRHILASRQQGSCSQYDSGKNSKVRLLHEIGDEVVVARDAHLSMFDPTHPRLTNQRAHKAADRDVLKRHPCKSGVAQQRR
jgi:hypothetical protein